MDSRLSDPAWRQAFEQAGDSACADWLEERRPERPAARDAAPPADRLMARNLCVQVGGANLLHAVDFSLAPGEVGAILGPNGAGKSTLAIHIAVGLLYSGRSVALLDLEYVEDVACDTDMNVVMTGAGHFVEVQGTAEGEAFSRDDMNAMLALAEKGIGELVQMQQQALNT